MKKGRDLLIVLAFCAVAFFIYAQLNGPDGSDDSTDDSSVDTSLDDIFDDFSSGSSDDSSTGTADVSSNDLATQWANLIQKFEGYFPGSRSYRNNNPGNIVGTGDAGSDSQGYAVYSSYAAGFQALVSDLTAKLAKYPNFSIAQIMARYAPAPNGNPLNAGNDPTTYAGFIASGLSKIFGGGITTATTLSQLLGMGA